MLSSMLTLAVLAVAAPVQAAQTEGAILRIEGPEIYAALGRLDGVRAGQTAQVYRRVTLKDGGQQLEDLFFIGETQVIEVGSSLTLLRGEPGFMARVDVGDVIRVELIPAPNLTPSTPVEASPWEASQEEETATEPESEEPAPPVETFAVSEAELLARQELSEFRDTFIASTAVSTEEDSRLWALYLERWPQSPAAQAINESLFEQRELVAALGKLAEKQAPPPLVATAVGPDSVRHGDGVSVSVAVRDVERVSSATLFYRRVGEPQYRFTAMHPGGDTVFGGWIPTEAVVAPGVEWFVQLSPEEGEPSHAGGSPGSPSVTEVVVDPIATPVIDRSQVSVAFEKVDFYSNQRTDQYSHAEVDVLYRLDRPSYRVTEGSDWEHAALYSV
ncbi:MAG: hypothetical protein QGG40_04200, partial [Myxococcota bacterium]|nr:hypothetical protein [Myxococcota bacterium]